MNVGDQIVFKCWIKTDPPSIGKGAIIGLDVYAPNQRLWEVAPQSSGNDQDKTLMSLKHGTTMRFLMGANGINSLLTLLYLINYSRMMIMARQEIRFQKLSTLSFGWQQVTATMKLQKCGLLTLNCTLSKKEIKTSSKSN